jgi:hypothetical protein
VSRTLVNRRHLLVLVENGRRLMLPPVAVPFVRIQPRVAHIHWQHAESFRLHHVLMMVTQIFVALGELVLLSVHHLAQIVCLDEGARLATIMIKSRQVSDPRHLVGLVA